ncbi:hypothetical protein KQX54_008263 [Cotesia glomerata]|uniref:Uncharacterized protein n=1 Tax=Cotesia glomerata TaxID=32391 RepID=A0AAV7HUE7_COTGL|nr:hypothetical protein KQX54_008263 [Cotesia glomerata]
MCFWTVIEDNEKKSYSFDTCGDIINAECFRIPISIAQNTTRTRCIQLLHLILYFPQNSRSRACLVYSRQPIVVFRGNKHPKQSHASRILPLDERSVVTGNLTGEILLVGEEA